MPWSARKGEAARQAFEDKLGPPRLPGEAGEALDLAVALGQSDELIGYVVLFHRAPGERTGEIGVVFDPAHCGRGYATEAVGEMVRIAFAELGLRRLTARVDDRNDASAALFARLGFRREAHLLDNEHVKGVLTSELGFGLLEREWARAG